MADSDKKQERVFRLPIEWHYPEGFESRYATNFIVQHTEQEFYLSFFDFPPPIFLGSEEEKLAQLEQIDSVQASAVARIVISPGRMQEFIDILQDNLRKYQDKFDVDEEE